VAIFQGDYTEAEKYYATAVGLWEGVDDPVGVSMTLTGHGLLAYRQGAYAEARERIERGLAVSQGADPADVAVRTNHIEQILILGDVAAAVGDLAEAGTRFEEATALAQTECFDWYLSDTLPGLGNVSLLRGDVDGAEALYREALPVAVRFGDAARLAGALVGLAAVAAARGQAELAARRIGAAEAQYEIAGTTVFQRDVRVADGARVAARRELGEDGYRAARELGRTESWEATIDEATDIAAEAGTTVTDRAGRHGLSPRELEVLRLLVAGKTDQEIADALFVGRRTVTTHTSHIFAKLGFTSRTEAAVWAVREGIT
jgi:non-specific serine/threonine protein kinase